MKRYMNNMKKAVIAAAFAVTASWGWAQQPVVAIAPFEAKPGISAADADAITEIYSGRLAAARAVRVVTRAALDKVVREHGFQSGDWSDDSKTAALGKALNADWVVRGTLQRLGSRYIVTVALLDIKSLEIMGSADMRLTSIDEAYDNMDAFVARTVQTIGGGAAAPVAGAPAKNAFAAGTGAAFRQAIAAINNDKAGGAYTVTLNGNVVSEPVAFTGGAAKTITLKGDGTQRVIAQNADGALFTVPKGVTLTLDNGVTLYGNDKTGTLVFVDGGTLRMNAGAALRGAKGGTTTTVLGNKLDSGGGVFVNGGTFTMAGGEISGNTANNSGGGVYMAGGAFTMQGGQISGNSAPCGGGVDVWSGTFTMQGGEIRGNTAKEDGGGVFVEIGAFTMAGGEIRGNTAKGKGGGVWVWSLGAFTKRGWSTIDASNSASNGKAVYVAVNDSSSPDKQRNSAAGPGVDLDSAISGSMGGWE